MEIIDFCDSFDNSVTYLIKNNNKAIVVDPANDIRIMEKYLDGVEILGIFLTHGHYDHFKELDSLLKVHKSIVYLHQQALNKLANKELSCAVYFGSDKEIKLDEGNYYLLKDRETLNIGGMSIKILYLPGHTNCSIGLLIGKDLFSGDVLFSNSVGRYDLPTGSFSATLSTINTLKKMDENITIHPGHESSFKLSTAKVNNSYMNK